MYRNMPVDLVLVRHGQSEGNLAQKISRHADVSGQPNIWNSEFRERHNSLYRLTDRGRMQAAVAGEWIRVHIDKVFDKYFTSEYVRAMETAAMLNLPSARWAAEMYLRERDRGVLANKSHKEREKHHPEEMKRKERDAFYWQPAGGESIANLCIRVDRVMENLCENCSGLRVIIVCHGGVIKSFRALIERVRSSEYRAMPNKIHNCQIVWYTRRDPVTGYISSQYNWVKSICPWDLSLSSSEWREIRRHVYSNEELLRSIRQVPQLVNLSLRRQHAMAAASLTSSAAELPYPTNSDQHQTAWHKNYLSVDGAVEGTIQQPGVCLVAEDDSALDDDECSDSDLVDDGDELQDSQLSSRAPSTVGRPPVPPRMLSMKDSCIPTECIQGEASDSGNEGSVEDDGEDWDEDKENLSSFRETPPEMSEGRAPIVGLSHHLNNLVNNRSGDLTKTQRKNKGGWFPHPQDEATRFPSPSSSVRGCNNTPSINTVEGPPKSGVAQENQILDSGEPLSVLDFAAVDEVDNIIQDECVESDPEGDLVLLAAYGHELVVKQPTTVDPSDSSIRPNHSSSTPRDDDREDHSVREEQEEEEEDEEDEEEEEDDEEEDDEDEEDESSQQPMITPSSSNQEPLPRSNEADSTSSPVDPLVLGDLPNNRLSSATEGCVVLTRNRSNVPMSSPSKDLSDYFRNARSRVEVSIGSDTSTTITTLSSEPTSMVTSSSCVMASPMPRSPQPASYCRYIPTTPPYVKCHPASSISFSDGSLYVLCSMGNSHPPSGGSSSPREVDHPCGSPVLTTPSHQLLTYSKSGHRIASVPQTPNLPMVPSRPSLTSLPLSAMSSFPLSSLGSSSARTSGVLSASTHRSDSLPADRTRDSEYKLVAYPHTTVPTTKYQAFHPPPYDKKPSSPYDVLSVPDASYRHVGESYVATADRLSLFGSIPHVQSDSEARRLQSCVTDTATAMGKSRSVSESTSSLPIAPTSEFRLPLFSETTNIPPLPVPLYHTSSRLTQGWTQHRSFPRPSEAASKYESTTN